MERDFCIDLKSSKMLFRFRRNLSIMGAMLLCLHTIPLTLIMVIVFVFMLFKNFKHTLIYNKMRFVCIGRRNILFAPILIPPLYWWINKKGNG